MDEEQDHMEHDGFPLYEEDDDQIVLLNSYFSDKKMFGDITKIPRGCIVKMTELKVDKIATM